MHTNPNHALDTDVLIVGAGPVGLFLANECARLGARWRLVETNAGQSIHSKALAIFPRTMEIFDMAGIAARFLEKANRVTRVAIMAHNRTLADMRFEPDNTPYPFVAMVPQNVTEELLAAELRRKDGNVEYRTTFVSAEQDEERVTALLEGPDGRTRVTASFIVGCDGAHSNVRHALALPLEGGEYEAAFLLADIESNESLSAGELQLCPSESGPLAIFPIAATRRRIVATIDQPEGDAPSLELVRRILAERAPAGFEAKAIHWSSYFRIHHRHVSRLRSGRIFLAGDAAHIHSPFGGQGMNTGLHDVWNLAWKLNLFLRGHGNQPLLDSYGAERLPVIRQVIETTDHLTRVMGTPSRFAQALRDTVIPMVSRLAPFQHAFVQRLSELGIAYSGSPIVEGPGERCFDPSMRGGGIKGRFLLLGKDAPGAAAALGGSLDEVLEVRASAEPGLILVRPDGYIAWSARHGGGSALEAVRTLLGRQTA